MKKNYFGKKFNKGLVALTLVFCALIAVSASAQRNIAWTGATNNNWSTASNWNYPAITSVATYASGSATITLASENNVIEVGDKVTGYGIPQDATVTVIDTTKKIITISSNTFAAVGTPGTNVIFTFAIPKTASAAPGVLDIAVINNGGNPTLAAGDYYVAGLTVGNNNTNGTASTLTIPNDVLFFVETSTSEGVLVKGGNIVNNGLLDIKSNLTGGSNNTAGAYGMVFGLPFVVPTVATEFTYSGTGELGIDTSLGNNFSGGFLFNGVNANANLATYKLLFNGITNFKLSGATAANGTASTHLMRAIGVGSLNACKVLISGAGFDFGTDSNGGATNGLLSTSGSGVDVTIDQGTTINMFSNSSNPSSVFGMYAFGSTAVPSFIRNNGTIIIKGTMQRSGLGLSAQNMATVNFVNNGVFEFDAKSVIAGNAGISLTNNQGATQQAYINVINTGTMTVKTLLNGGSWGAPIVMTTFSGAPNIIVDNSGTLNLIGSNYNFGSKPWDPNGTNSTTIVGASRINNSGTINTNQELRAFYTINSGTITFLSTPELNPLKLVTFTIPTVSAASLGSTYTDLNSNVYTVVVNKVSGTGTTIVAHANSNVIPPLVNPIDALLPVTLTKTGGDGDDSITYTAQVSNGNNAHFQGCVNSGTINTNTGNSAMTFYDGVITAASTSVISPGGNNGKGRAVFGDSATNAINLLGTFKIQVSGNTAVGVDYDLLRFPGKLDAIDISQATLDVTEIYTPTEATTIDILTAFDDTAVPYDDITNQSGAIVSGGPFATVLGLPASSGWKVNYNTLPGKVQLVFDPASLSTADNTFSKFKFNYYPNPTSNVVNLSAEKNISKVEIYTITGQKVQSNSVNASQKQLNISNLQRGVYMMEVSIDNAKKTFKIVKQ